MADNINISNNNNSNNECNKDQILLSTNLNYKINDNNKDNIKNLVFNKNYEQEVLVDEQQKSLQQINFSNNGNAKSDNDLLNSTKNVIKY